MSVTEIGKCQSDFVLSTPTFLDTMFSGEHYVLAQSSLCDFNVYQDFKFFFLHLKEMCFIRVDLLLGQETLEMRTVTGWSLQTCVYHTIWA